MVFRARTFRLRKTRSRRSGTRRLYTDLGVNYHPRRIPAAAHVLLNGSNQSVAAHSDSCGVPNRILIVQLGAIGDVVRALPLLGRIRRGWPRAYIAWAVEPKSSAILEKHPWVDELIIYDRNRTPWSLPRFVLALRRGRFDLVLDLQRHLKSGLMARATGATMRWGFDRSNTKELNHIFSTHTVEPQPPMRLKLLQYQAFGDALGLAPAPIEFGLSPSEGERKCAAALLSGAPRPLLGIILGSSWPSRFWFPEATAAAIRGLATPCEGVPALHPVLLGSGATETDFARAVKANLGPVAVLDLVGRTSLRELIAVLEQCAVAFGPDCGPMHIAAAVGCPIVSLWGSTAPERSAPWGYAEYTLIGDIPCHPCYLRQCPIGRECMRRIEPLEVAAAVRRAFVAASAARSAAP